MTNDTTQPSASPTRPAAMTGAKPESGSDGWIFWLFQLLIVYEYVGLKNFIGPAQVLRPSTVLAFLLVAFSLKRLRRIDLLDFRQGQLHVAFIFMTAASVLWAIVRSYAAADVTPHVGYFGFGIIAMYATTTRERLFRLGTTCTVVTAILVVRNLGKLTSSVRLGAFEAAPFLGDGNDFAWGLNVFLPLILFLVIAPKSPLWRRGIGLVGLACGGFGIVGTQSRGAAIALGLAALYYWAFVTKRKGLGAATMAVGLVALLAVAPGKYLERMNSVTQYEEDGSAQGRLRAWKAATQMALDYPLGVGAGNFNSAFGRFYMPADTTGAWGATRWISTHSVYFKVLAEYGFIGLAMLLWLLVANFRDNLRTRRIIAANPSAYEFSELWPAMLNMSLIAYSVSGIFLGGIAYPHLYLITGLTLGARRSLAHAAIAPAIATAAGGGTRPPVRSVTLWPGQRSPGTLPQPLAQRRGGVR